MVAWVLHRGPESRRSLLAGNIRVKDVPMNLPGAIALAGQDRHVLPVDGTGAPPCFGISEAL